VAVVVVRCRNTILPREEPLLALISALELHHRSNFRLEEEVWIAEVVLQVRCPLVRRGMMMVVVAEVAELMVPEESLLMLVGPGLMQDRHHLR
jgi:hypothetical protein